MLVVRLSDMPCFMLHESADRNGLLHRLLGDHAFLSCRNVNTNASVYGTWYSFSLCSYDTHGVFSSPRALFMFRSFGHDRSSILDGGLPAWIAHGCPVEPGEPSEVKKPSGSTYPPPFLDETVIRSE